MNIQSPRTISRFVFFVFILSGPTMLLAQIEDRLAIREASGRYSGNFNGLFLVGEDVNQTDPFASSTRMPRKKGRFKSRFLLSDFEGAAEFKGNIRKIKVRGKKVRYRGVIRYPSPLGADPRDLVGLLNAVSKKKKSGHILKYPITISRFYDADILDGLDEDFTLALLLNFKGSK